MNKGYSRYLQFHFVSLLKTGRRQERTRIAAHRAHHLLSDGDCYLRGLWRSYFLSVGALVLVRRLLLLIHFPQHYWLRWPGNNEILECVVIYVRIPIHSFLFLFSSRERERGRETPFCHVHFWGYIRYVAFNKALVTTSQVPGRTVAGKNEDEEVESQQIIVTVYLLVGSALVAMCFNLMQEETIENLKMFWRRLGCLRKNSHSENEEDPSVTGGWQRQPHRGRQRPRFTLSVAKKALMPDRVINVIKYTYSDTKSSIALTYIWGDLGILYVK